MTPPTLTGADLIGAFVLEVTIALSLTISWASYAADFSRYLPVDSSKTKVFGYTFGGMVLAYIFVQGIGIAAADVIGAHTAEGVRDVMGGGVRGRFGAAHHRAGLGGLRCDERLQRFTGPADPGGSGSPAGVGGRGDRPGVLPHPLAGGRRHPRRSSSTCCC